MFALVLGRAQQNVNVEPVLDQALRVALPPLLRCPWLRHWWLLVCSLCSFAGCPASCLLRRCWLHRWWHTPWPVLAHSLGEWTAPPWTKMGKRGTQVHTSNHSVDWPVSRICHMYVGYQIRFSNLSHNATWGNHPMYVQIALWEKFEKLCWMMFSILHYEKHSRSGFNYQRSANVLLARHRRLFILPGRRWCVISPLIVIPCMLTGEVCPWEKGRPQKRSPSTWNLITTLSWKRFGKLTFVWGGDVWAPPVIDYQPATINNN